MQKNDIAKVNQIIREILNMLPMIYDDEYLDFDKYPLKYK